MSRDLPPVGPSGAIARVFQNNHLTPLLAILAVILLTDNSQYPVATQALTALVMLAILLVTLCLLLMSTQIMRVLGRGGASILTRIMGMILAAFSVELVMDAMGAERWLAGAH